MVTVCLRCGGVDERTGREKEALKPWRIIVEKQAEAR